VCDICWSGVSLADMANVFEISPYEREGATNGILPTITSAPRTKLLQNWRASKSKREKLRNPGSHLHTQASGIERFDGTLDSLLRAPRMYFACSLRCPPGHLIRYRVRYGVGR